MHRYVCSVFEMEHQSLVGIYHRVININAVPEYYDEVYKQIEANKKCAKTQSKHLETEFCRAYRLSRPLREFCVSDFRQNQEYHVINVHDEGLFPLVTFLPGGWDGMLAGTA